MEARCVRQLHAQIEQSNYLTLFTFIHPLLLRLPTLESAMAIGELLSCSDKCRRVQSLKECQTLLFQEMSRLYTLQALKEFVHEVVSLPLVQSSTEGIDALTHELISYSHQQYTLHLVPCPVTTVVSSTSHSHSPPHPQFKIYMKTLDGCALCGKPKSATSTVCRSCNNDTFSIRSYKGDQVIHHVRFCNVHKSYRHIHDSDNKDTHYRLSQYYPDHTYFTV